MKQAASRISHYCKVRKFQRAAAGVIALGYAVMLTLPAAVLAGSETVAAKGPLARNPDSGTAVAQIRRVSRQVYRLLVDMDGGMKGGTAFLVSGQRVVATNNHVVDGGRAFWLGYLDAGGNVRRLPLHLIATYPQKDLALLETREDLPGKPLPLTTQIPLAASNLYALGFPAAADPQGGPNWGTPEDESFFLPSVLIGYVSRVLTNRWLTSRLQHQTPIVPGYSGGPLVNDEGAVVGISTSIHKEANGISYAVLAADLAEFTAACSLPAAGDHLPQPPAPVHETEAPPPPVDQMNTHAVRERRPLTEAERKILNRAEIALRNGAIYDARLICQHLVNTTQATEAYLCLGRTYDPAKLKELGVVGTSGDATLAQFYYGQAAHALRQPPDGVPQAANPPSQALAMADGRTCDASLCKLVSRGDGPAVTCERRRGN